MIDEEISLKELKEEATNFHAFEAVKRAFIRCTNTQSWDDANNKFPSFTSEDRLKQFVKMDFRHSIPDVSKIYCQSALNSQMPTGGTVHLVDGIRVALVRGTLPSTSAQEIKEVDSNYTGA